MMRDLLGLGSMLMPQAIAFGLDLALKSTVILLPVFCIHKLLGGRRALTRSALWNACLVGLLTLPAFIALSPRWRIQALGRIVGERNASTISVDLSNDRPRIQEPVKHTQIPLPDQPRDFLNAHRNLPGVGESFAHLAERGPDNRLAGQAKPTDSAASDRPVWIGLFVTGYVLVAAVLALRLLAAFVSVARLRRNSVVMNIGTWNEALEHWRNWLKIGTAVSLDRSPDVSIPVTIGWQWPAILVPDSLSETDDPKLANAVLLHELCHIRRADYAWNIAWKAAQIIYWPQPLIWLAGRVVRDVREQACDELCVHALGGGQPYRTALVEIATGLSRRQTQRPAMGLGLAMAQSSRLARRLDDINRMQGRSACRLGCHQRWAITTVLVAIAVLLGALEQGPQPARAMIAAQTANPNPKPSVPQVAAASSSRALPELVELTVVDARTGKPLAGATVRNWIDFRTDDLTTDDHGKVQVPRSTHFFRDQVSVDVWKDGYIQQRFGWGAEYEDGSIPDRFTVRLLPGELAYGGSVTDEAGKPIPGVKVELWGYLKEKKEPHELCYRVRSTTDSEGRWQNSGLREMTFIHLYLSHPDFLADGDRHARAFGSPGDREKPASPDLDRLRTKTDVQVMKRGVELTGRVVDEHGVPIADAEVGLAEDRNQFNPEIPKTRSDSQGHFRFAHARPGKLAILAKSKNHAPRLVMIEAGASNESHEIRLKPGRVFQGQVVNPEGRPIEGAFVNVDTWIGYRCLGVYFSTDNEGRFRWEHAPPDGLRLNVDKPGFVGIHLRDIPSESNGTTFTLVPSLRISGRVRDSITGKVPQGLIEIQRGTTDPQTGQVAQWLSEDRLNIIQGDILANLDSRDAKSIKLRIIAAGYEPFISRTIQSGETNVRLNVELKKLTAPAVGGLSGVVVSPEGKPLANAQVVMSTASSHPERSLAKWVSVVQGQVENANSHVIATTGPDGSFSMTPRDEPFEILALTDHFYARATKAEFEAAHELKCQPWGRIEGQVLTGTKPGSGCYVSISTLSPRSSVSPFIGNSDRVQTDAEGRFTIGQIMAGNILLFHGLQKEGNQVWSHGNRVISVEPGKTTRVTLGGSGRPVIGRLVQPPDFGRTMNISEVLRIQIHSNRTRNYFPMKALKGTNVLHELIKAVGTPEQLAYEGQFVGSSSVVTEDGSFRLEDLPAGTYRLSSRFERGYELEGKSTSGRGLSQLEYFFQIPEMPGGRSDEPLDLGTIPLRLRNASPLTDGAVSPTFELTTLDGKPLRLSDHRGKLVLLNFWAPWNEESLFQIPYLKELARTFDGKPFVMINLIPDASDSEVRRLTAEVGLPGELGFLGQWATSPVIQDYQLEFLPATFLIGADGKIISCSNSDLKRMWMTNLKDEVARALERR